MLSAQILEVLYKGNANRLVQYAWMWIIHFQIFSAFPGRRRTKIIIVSGVLNSGCERSGGWYGKRGGNGWATGPPFLRKSCKKAVKLIISRLFVVDLIGIEPTTLRMRTVRSPSWAIGPYLVVLYIFACSVCAVCCSDRARVMLRLLSQLSYRPIFGYFVYFCLFCLCSLLFWPGPCYVALALPAEL